VEANHTADVLIAGQGAAAYAAALYAARYRMNALVVAGEFGGETATAGLIENYPGVAPIGGFDLMLQFREQVTAYDVPVLDERVASVAANGHRWAAKLENGDTVDAASIIFAIGRERRTLSLPHEAEWVGKGVSYCSTCDAPLFRDKVVAVVGGGNAAVEGALLCARYADQVLLVYRGSEFSRPEPMLISLLRDQSNVDVRFNTEVSALHGTEQHGLQGVRLKSRDGASEDVTVSGIFIEIGSDPRGKLPRSLGVSLNPATGEVHVDRLGKTNIPGILAAGDLTDGSGPVKQTITAASQGAVAAYSAYQYVLEARGT
jgi:thioredoxin reductase (NADPH)